MNDNGDAGKASRSHSETDKAGANQNHKVKKKVDMKDVQCYYCRKFDHYARDWNFNKDNGDYMGVS